LKNQIRKKFLPWFFEQLSWGTGLQQYKGYLKSVR
jgi:hypothetical protein